MRQNIQVGFQIWQIESHEKPIRTKSAAVVFGQGWVVPEPVFYAYAYPALEGFRDYSVQPKEAFYSSEMQEFILPYEAMRQAYDPDAILLAFLQNTYEAAANLGHWDRAALERTSALKG